MASVISMRSTASSPDSDAGPAAFCGLGRFETARARVIRRSSAAGIALAPARCCPARPWLDTCQTREPQVARCTG